ncbi:MAG TPA: choice-of-anchor U domain-containing protein [Desulfatiglandales bacterium]|nr:choice-of-anchor U domain-containing protein [Desulfatiglandales bacterium]
MKSKIVQVLTMLVVFFVMIQTSTTFADMKKIPKGKNKNFSKISRNLPGLESIKTPKAVVGKTKLSNPITGLVKFHKGLPEIEVNLKVLTPEILQQIQNIGLEVHNYNNKRAQVVGVCELELLDKIADIPEVVTIRPNYKPILNAGAVDSQADTSIRADFARVNFGVDGTGVTVGILSDSFHDIIGGTITGSGCSRILSGSDSQNTGDLPSSVVVLDNGPGGGSDEGAGMAELVHDLAPGASISFHTAWNGRSDFAQGITDLFNCGADIIVDDIIYYAEPMFQDGWIAQAAQNAVDNGVAYFSSAGNHTNLGIDENYTDINPAVNYEGASPPTGNDFHDFGGGNPYALITMPAGCTVRAVLQWNDPYDGTLGPGAADDLDLWFYYESALGVFTPLWGSENAQGCSIPSVNGGDPLEITSVTYIGDPLVDPPIDLYLVVNKYCGTGDNHFRIVLFTSGCGGAIFGPMFGKSTIYGHSAAKDATAVAAVRYDEIDTGGNVLSPDGTINVETFSSLGGYIPFYFDGSGNLLPGAPVTRFKPEIAAPDGTNTTFFGGFDYEPDGWPNFFGTSASAPHAAAIAALMLDENSSLTPQQLVNHMRDTAIDIESPGIDFLSGNGLIDAQNAVDAAQVPPPPDSDNDGLYDYQEQGLEGNNLYYDGNGDGIPDYQQNNVVSFITWAQDGSIHYITLEVPLGQHFVYPQAQKKFDNPPPAGVTLPYGFFSFTITGLRMRESTVMTIYPDGEPPQTYYKYGKTSDNQQDHWYEFSYDGETGAEVVGNTIVLHLADGKRGDNGLTANSVITDPGGPAEIEAYEALYFPYIATTDGQETVIGIINTENYASTSTISYYGENGDLIQTATITLGPKGKATILPESIPQNSASAIVSADGNLLGYTRYTNSQGKRCAWPANTHLKKSISVPHPATDINWKTALSLFNPTDENAVVTVGYDSGTTSTLTINAKSRSFFWVTGTEPISSITSTGYISAMEMFESLTSGGDMAAILLSKRSNLKALYVPYISYGSGEFTGIGLKNGSYGGLASVFGYSETGEVEEVSLDSVSPYESIPIDLSNILSDNKVWAQIYGEADFSTPAGTPLLHFQGLAVYGEDNKARLGAVNLNTLKFKEGFLCILSTDPEPVFSLLNPDTQDTTIIVTAYQSDGAVLASNTIQVRAGDSITGAFSYLFDGASLANVTHIRIVSAVDIYGFETIYTGGRMEMLPVLGIN